MLHNLLSVYLAIVIGRSQVTDIYVYQFSGLTVVEVYLFVYNNTHLAS